MIAAERVRQALRVTSLAVGPGAQSVPPAKARAELSQILNNSTSRPKIVTFTSSSTVHNFARASTGANLDEMVFASIGPITSATLCSYGFRPAIEAESYTMHGLARAIVQWARKQN